MALVEQFCEGLRPSQPSLLQGSTFPNNLAIVSINIAVKTPGVATALWEGYEIATRPGGATRLASTFRHHGTGMVRFSFSCFNTEEIEVGIQALSAIAQEAEA